MTESTELTGDGMELEEPSNQDTVEEPCIPPEPELPSEFDRLFRGCEENPEDFNGWVYLLQYVEQEVRDGDVTFSNSIGNQERTYYIAGTC